MRPTQAGHKQINTVKVAEKEKGMEINLKIGVCGGERSTFLGVGGKQEILRWQIVKCGSGGYMGLLPP